MSSGEHCPRCGEDLGPWQAGPNGRFRVCADVECQAVVPESPTEWRERVQRQLDDAEARAIRLTEHLDRIDELIHGLPEGSIKDGKRVA